jgi:hypothetical protein
MRTSRSKSKIDEQGSKAAMQIPSLPRSAAVRTRRRRRCAATALASVMPHLRGADRSGASFKGNHGMALFRLYGEDQRKEQPDEALERALVTPKRTSCPDKGS